LAAIYATCPNAKYRDGKKAVENASKAQQLSGGSEYTTLGTLAAAYAESGDFAKAREFQEKAINLAPEKSNQEMRSRLELYKQRKPYHEQPVKK
jgi:Flp pilus assembly protein TadD